MEIGGRGISACYRRNRTKTITMSGGNNMNFSYDGTERRVYKKDVVNSVTTEILYLHDGMNAIVERSKTGTPTEYIYGPTGIIAIKTPSSTNFILKDHLGSTRVLLNSSNAVITTYDYSAFGTILSTPSSSAYLYTGQEWDQTSALHNFKARMYDSDLAMFYGADAAGQFASPYLYSGANPIAFSDPSGNFSFKKLLGSALIGYQAFSVLSNAVKAYNNAGGGLYGFGEAFSVVNRSIISWGAGFAVGGAVGSAIGPASGLIPNVASGAATGAASAGASALTSGQNFYSSFRRGAITGGIAGGVIESIDYLTSQNGQGNLNNTTGNSSNEDYSPPDPEFIDKAMDEMFLYGSELGRLQWKEIRFNNTTFLIDNSLDGYGAFANYRNFWNWVIGKRQPTIYLNARLLFDANHKSNLWRGIGVSANDYITKTVQSIYHESGHLFGLREYVGGKIQVFTNEQITHGIFPHDVFEFPIGEMTERWLVNDYLRILRANGVVR